jgi:hypothetical protein
MQLHPYLNGIPLMGVRKAFSIFPDLHEIISTVDLGRGSESSTIHVEWSILYLWSLQLHPYLSGIRLMEVGRALSIVPHVHEITFDS